MAKEQRIVHFAGNVQGVGFRYTACRIAAGFDVTGYVRNLPDGRVECVVEGDAGQVGEFLSALAERMRGCIRNQTAQSAPYSGGFHSFGVRY